jgi:hypothetical protein
MKTMKGTTINLGVLVTTALVVSAYAFSPLAGPQDDAVTRLARQVGELEMRLSRLEAQIVQTDPSFLEQPVSPALLAPSGARRLVVESVQTIPAQRDSDTVEELARVESEIAALERTIESIQQRMASATGRGSQADRKRRSDAQLISEYRNKLRRKRAEATRLQRQLDEPTQIIFGHQGSTLIELRTTRDQSRALSSVDLGDAISWTGRRLRVDEDGEEWLISSIERAQ